MYPDLTKTALASLLGSSPRPRELASFLEKNAPWLFAKNFDEFYEPYRSKGRKLRLAHQPNFLPSIAIADQFAYGEHLAEKYDISFEYLSMDYDACQNERYRTGYLFRTRGHSLISEKLRLPCQRNTLILRQPLAKEDWLSRARNKIISCRGSLSSNETGKKKELSDHDVFGDIERAFFRSESQVEANQKLIEDLVSFTSPIVSGSQRLKESSDSLAAIFRQSADINRLMIDAIELMGLSRPHDEEFCPMWYVGRDGRRLEVRYKMGGYYEVVGSSGSTNRTLQFSSSSLLELSQAGKIIPRIVADDLLDAVDGRFDLGIAYLSGIEHYVFSAVVAVGLGVKLMPEFFSTIEKLPSELKCFHKVPPNNMISAHFAMDAFGYDPSYAVLSPMVRCTPCNRVL